MLRSGTARRHERKDKEGRRVTREGLRIENTRGDRGGREEEGSLISWPGREGVEDEGARVAGRPT